MICYLNENLKYDMPIGGLVIQAQNLLPEYEKQVKKLSIISKYSNKKHFPSNVSNYQFLDLKDNVKSTIIRHLFYYKNNIIYSILFSLDCAFKVIKIHRKEKIDIINFQGLDFLYLPSVLLAKILGIKNFYKLTEPPTENYTAYFLTATHNQVLNHILYFTFLKLTKFLINRADYIQALTPQIKDILENRFDYPEKRIFVIPNGINYEKFKNLYHPSLNTFGFVGRLHEVKNISTIINAFYKFSLKYPNFHLAIFGGGPEEEKLHSIVEEKNLNNKVQFYGFKKNPKEIYSSFDYFINASFYEGISNAVLEAMAAGIPVIASNVIGNNNVIEDKRDGILFDPNDVDDLVEKMSKLVENDSLCNKLRKNALYKIKNEYDIQIIVKRILNYIWPNILVR